MLKLQLIGNLGADAEIRQVGERSVISFNVAHSEKYTDRNTGQLVDKTVWVGCSYWRQPTQTGVAKYLTKGKKVFVEGEPSVRTYQNREGATVATLDLRVINLELLGGNTEPGQTNPNYDANNPAGQPYQSQQGQQQQPQQVSEPAAAPQADVSSSNAPPDDDDLPF